MANKTKKKNRKMMRQIRKTLGALFMASALVVAVIPVQESKASNTDPANWVRCLNYTSNISTTGAWETTPKGTEAVEEWKSYVPKVDDDIDKYPIYTTSTANNTVQYRFAFVPSENGSGTNVAVILGANTSNVKNNTLTIESKVDAFKKYSYNTSVTNFCAVSMDDSFLYYLSKFQRKEGTVGYYKVFNNEYEPEAATAEYKDIPEGYVNRKTDGIIPTGVPAGETDTCNYRKLEEIMKTDTSTDPVSKVLNVIITTYSVESYEEEEMVDGVPTMVTKYRWKENVSNQTYTLEESTIDGLQPCFDSTESTWKPLGDSALYYYSGSNTEPDLSKISDFTPCASTSQKQRIHDVEVWYIGQQYVEEITDGVWKIMGDVTETNPEKGVFAGLTNVTNLELPSTLQGVGDCAFYGSQIKKVRFDESGNIRTIGNSAFANCISLSEVYIPLYSQVKIIGKAAFFNDYSLISFTLPTSVYAIGDYAFQNCTGLQVLDLTSENNANYLNAIGYHAFENCSSLTSIEFSEKFMQDSNGLPDAVKNKVPINTFKGCTNIDHITIRNNALDIADGLDPSNSEDENHALRDNKDLGKDDPLWSDCDIDKFVNNLNDPDSFYFEGMANTGWEIYQTAVDHCISYKHLGEEIYERVVECSEASKHKNTFTVNGTGEIVAMDIKPECEEIVIPEKIGKIGISKLSGTSFTDKCFIKKVYIPKSIGLIESGAFRGCHRLEAVIFTQPENPDLVIEDGAFDTQNVGVHASDCDGKLNITPFLSFTGTISDTSAPFQYAMNPSNNINVGTQTLDTYIYFYSGWPTNLTVKYNPETDKNTLIDCPVYDDLSNIENKHITVVVDRATNATQNYYIPYLTSENISAARSAVNNYQDYKRDPEHVDKPTEDEYSIINSALNVVLPAGVEAIQTGLFSNLDTEGKKVDGSKTANKMLQTITMNTVEEIEPYAFADCSNDNLSTGKFSAGLTGVYQNPTGGISVGDYAFRNCTSLTDVSIASTVNDFGIRPFMGCDNLNYVNFYDSPYYTCSDAAIIFELDGSGNKSKIMECLECRGKSFGNAKVGPSELAGITDMAEEAFMDCDGIGQVDLKESSLSKVSERAFALTDQLGSVLLPETCKSIGRGAFWNTSMYYIEVPHTVTLVQPEAFANVETTDKYQEVPCQNDQYITYQSNGDPQYKDQTSGHKTITAYCVEDSAMDTYAVDYYYINPEFYRPTIYHTVYFWDTFFSSTDPDLIETQQVADGEDAIPPEFPSHSGVTATAWTPNYTGVVRDQDVTTVYTDTMHKVWFQYTDTTDPDNPKIVKLTEEQLVEHGKSATPPATEPYNEGYVFTGWTPDYRNIYDDGAIIAVFKSATADDRHKVTFYGHDGSVVASYKVDDGGSVTPPAGPARSGYTFVGWVPGDFSNITSDITSVATYEKISNSGSGGSGSGGSGSGSGSGSSSSSKASPSPSPTSSSSDSVKKYTVSVSGGSGSGSYAAGAIVAINAFDRGTGQKFDKWTTSTAGVGFANAEAVSTTFTMPAANVAITATYKTDNGSSSGGSNSGGTGGSGGSSSGQNNNTGTTVEVTKPGISNTNLAGATVSGATDNFVVKVTEDQSATNAVVAALQAKYGDISRIKYLPMDISLYDSTGRTKIADTSGITVNLTLPLPDDLAQYAGNNKVAAVSNGALEDLNARFTTVDGVPCVNFTATHFSPYVIYVDTANLTEGTIDATPKTGDPIHPKWFLALGLACISMILFFKKDKAVVKAKTA